MAFIVLVIETPAEGIGQLNAQVQRPGKPHEAVIQLRNYMDAIMGGAVDSSIQVTTRDSAPAVSTSGSGSQQESYNLK